MRKDESGLANELLRIVDNLDASQLKLEKGAFDVINTSDTSLNLVKDGMKEIKSLITKIDEMNDAVAVSQKCIDNMKKLADVIANFAVVISGISNQTNMLSLNASIEAARAGEHGRGFAVVATQVQNLATQSKTSSAEISSKIKEVRSYVDEMVRSIDDIYTNADQQTQMASSIDELLKKMLDAAGVANDASRNIENEIAVQRDITDEVKNSLRMNM